MNDHLQVGTKATAVYIGKMVLPKKSINDTDNDQAHIQADAVPHINFGYADPEHNFIVDKILKPDQGVTYELFNDAPPEEAEAEAAPEVDDEGNEIPKPVKEPEEILPKKLVVNEVVRESKIHFFKVPKLGSYMAIRLEYETCLFEEALDSGVSDALAINEKARIQQEEKQAHEKQQAELQE